MEKLRLNVEELRVQSFVADDADERIGTVHAQELAAPSPHCGQTDHIRSCPLACTP
jgi:hypothetical protein